MVSHVRHNPYQGVNAHLQSYFQQRGGWESFHVAFNVYLRDTLQSLIPDGYFVMNERSLQINAIDLGGGRGRQIDLRPDIAVFKPVGALPPVAAPAAVATPNRVIPLIDTLVDVEDEFLSGIVIYRAAQDGDLGSPITRLESLSPSNKPPGSNYPQYRAKRDALLKSGIHLIEIDFLHERRFPVDTIPSYPQREPGATPYNILVDVAARTSNLGESLHYGFVIDTPIPIIPVPLVEQSIALNLNDVYNHVFATNPAYGALLDYTQPPLGFDSYTAEDQARIRARMAQITNA
ncbi:MAG: DUF4058 family protein [Chloroflexota bacterium]|nr:DUF4058 family protein [Chloroflexota bacterium]